MAQAQKTYLIGQITSAELDALSARHPQGNFQQTSNMAALVKPTVKAVDFVGVRKAADGSIVAGCMIAYTKGHLGLEGSIWVGPLCDEDDTELLAAMTRAITVSARKHHAVSVSCWPGQVYMRRTSDGEPDGAADDLAIDNMKRLGWRHAGFDRGYGSIVNRWVYVKDLSGVSDEKALLKSYDKRTQWSVKRASSMGVHVRELGVGELGVFADIERQTAERRGFEYRGEGYFRRFKEAFGGAAHFMVAEIHVAEYVADMEAKRDALQAKVEALQAKQAQHPTTRTERQLGEETRNLEAARKRLAEAAEYAGDGDVLPAAASLFVENPRETVYLFSGSVERYKPFYASALIQHWAMLHLCVERGVGRYNFYGISGVFDDPDDEGRGVLEFKQGFNGYVEELVGEFTLPVSHVRFALMQGLRKLLKR
ncbi:alanine adding enzyme [Pseudoscardovia suis]|uniref:Peptidoglycan bridge formation protein FemAB n=2 Tax=Pseudoscardovia suis TaxID=987063 RepID=A0A261EW70_9BIFI|nr:aminoacyltransferase [Pseudoscardovia suis]OZG51124.1 peptidoglycan bridge formation protein FemAB [Pseudoscardovia suis]PJJ65916.1 alanine adding enzyme [Pseudoscardovia suis]